MRILCLGGGGLRGAFQVPVLERLLAEEEYDLVVGVSAGALNGAFAAQRDVTGMYAHWADVRTRRSVGRGVRGMIGINRQPWKSLYTLDPLMARVVDRVCLREMTIPFAIGAVIAETAEFRVGHVAQMKSDDELHRWIRASMAIAGLFEPVPLSIDGQTRLCVDGGYRHYLAIPPDVARTITHLDAIFCAPFTGQPYRTRRGLQHQLAWGFEVALQAARALEIERLRELSAERGVRVRVYVPSAPAGGLLDGRPEIMAHRLALGRRAATEPVVL